ncbi:MAG TPA: MFS transporter [Chloroflexota bacterium]
MRSVLRHRDYRIFAIGQTFSVFGSQFTTVAMAWQIYELTNSPLQIGALGLARAVPQMVLTLFGGVLADALDRRRLLMVTQLAQFCVSASLVVITLAGLISPGVLYGATVLMALAAALDNPARQAMVPNMVPASELTEALTLTNAQRTLGNIAGPSLAGLVLAFASAGICYAVDAASWIVMLGALVLMRGPFQAAVGRRAVSLSAVGSGVAFVWTHPILLSFMALDFAQNFFGTPRALLPIFARDILGVGASGLGMLYSAISIGSLVGAVIVSRIPRRDQAGWWVLAGVAVYGLSILVFSLSSVFWLSLVALAGSGAGNTISVVFRGTSNQLLTPDELRGRVASVNSVFTMGGPQLGQFQSGVLASLWGAEFSAGFGGTVVVLVALAVAMVPSVRSFDLTNLRAHAARVTPTRVEAG